MASLFKRHGKGNWVIQYFDHAGKRREKSARTIDKAAAKRIANDLEAKVALRRDGIVDPRMDGYNDANRKPLSAHIADYVEHCRHAGHAAHYVNQKSRQLCRLMDEGGLSRLSDLTPDALERHLRLERDKGRSARTANFIREIAIAFMGWCKDTNRIESNALQSIKPLNQDRDRRRIRRPLSDDELARLLAVAEPRGRKAWYMAAALAGLRKGDLQRLTWADIDFEHGSITIKEGKAKREDIIPMHPQLADELAKRRDESMATPMSKVFAEPVHNLTRHKDFLRARLAREEIVTDDSGEPVMIGKGRHRRPKTRITTEDEQGRVIDLHALRTTLGTNLAKAGVKPQHAQRIMRHADYRTTLKHYTVLGLTDTSEAISQLPDIALPHADELQATGTDDVPAARNPSTTNGSNRSTPTHNKDLRRNKPQQFPQHFARETMRISASRCDEQTDANQVRHARKSLRFTKVSEDMRSNAKRCEKRPLRDLNPCFQDENLMSWTRLDEGDEEEKTIAKSRNAGKRGKAEKRERRKAGKQKIRSQG